MNCPKHNNRYYYNDYITPSNKDVIAIVHQLSGNQIESCFNYVSLNIEYVIDKQQYGFDEYWAFPEETISRRMGDCEDTSFLLASLLLASGINQNYIRVVIGFLHRKGHAWVEVDTSDYGWLILESTSDDVFCIGRNAYTIKTGYSNGYVPTTYVYNNSCIRV
ncbi:MAG: transglutaminase domain-containing protein [Bacteroidia bacterium]|nr:transglutaminase domain-containing protein [Bacteroidia bacterium]